VPFPRFRESKKNKVQFDTKFRVLTHSDITRKKIISIAYNIATSRHFNGFGLKQIYHNFIYRLNVLIPVLASCKSRKTSLSRKKAVKLACSILLV